MDQIFNILEGAPIIVNIIVWISIIAAFVGFLIYTIKEYNIKIKKLIPNNKNKQLKLLEHNFFEFNQYMDKFIINKLFFGDADRNIIFKLVATTINDVTSTKLRQLLENNDIIHISSFKFTQLMYEVLDDIVHTYTDEIKVELMSQYPHTGDKIFELIMHDNKKGYFALNCQYLEFLEELIKLICTTAAYDDNLLKMDIILSNYKTSLDIVIPYLEKTFYNFNGDLQLLINENNDYGKK